jgi:ABC-2 type transport system ATP-binding protein
MTYSGTALTGASTWVYAQIVDLPRNLVLGTQVTPIPVTLDGRTHTVSRRLEAIAAHIVPGSQLELQIVPGTGIYTPQRALGPIAMSTIELRLPIVTAEGTL